MLFRSKVSHSNVKTRTRWMPNLKAKKYLIPELGQTISMLLSARAIRTIDKFGNISSAIMNAKDEVLSTRLMKVKRGIYNNRVKASAAGKSAATAAAPKAPKAPRVAKAPAAGKAKVKK